MMTHRSIRTFSRGFTLIELLVVIAILGILASLLLPVLGKAKGKGQSAACLSNLKQLQYGWQMYVQDNHEDLPPNISDGYINFAGSWVVGSAAVDTDTANIKAGLLFPAIGSASAYHCPADQSVVQNRPQFPHNRSYSIPQWYNSSVSRDLLQVNNSSFNKRKLSQLMDPPPVGSWIFIDEHALSIDDGIFVIGSPWFAPGAHPPDHDFWVSFPADRHQDGANLSFADGHVLHHRWNFHRNISSYAFVQTSTVNSADLADVHWLHQGIPHIP
jgi:prepilin-type N-terminal cleavage/methylation domain-containing protein/prepilin-type processing-associated H-X9-DG protein